MTATTLPNPPTTPVVRYVGFALAVILAFGIGMVTSVIVFDDDTAPARSSATRSESTSSPAAPTMSADAAERLATSGVEVYQRKASVETAEQKATTLAATGPSPAVEECRASAHAPDAIERCAATGR